MTPPGPRAADTGSAVVDFVLVGVLLTFLLGALFQLALVLHVRNTLIDCASEGARYGALADRLPADGVSRTRALVTADLSGRYARYVSAGFEVVDRVETVVVRIEAPLPVLGLAGADRMIRVSGHALREP
ncbi:MAG: hypothetical protein QG622_2187 [Actinomycetota bacterium]|nr:hypothetical protein [Actinomycetota bacterium]